VQNRPAKQKENQHTTPENPLILARAPLDHPNGIAAHAQRIGNAIQAALRAFEDLALLAQIGEHGAAAVQEVVKLVVRAGEEGLLAQGV
jgi:hypothetical protein